MPGVEGKGKFGFASWGLTLGLGGGAVKHGPVGTDGGLPIRPENVNIPQIKRLRGKVIPREREIPDRR